MSQHLTARFDKSPADSEVLEKLYSQDLHHDGGDRATTTVSKGRSYAAANPENHDPNNRRRHSMARFRVKLRGGELKSKPIKCLSQRREPFQGQSEQIGANSEAAPITLYISERRNRALSDSMKIIRWGMDIIEAPEQRKARIRRMNSENKGHVFIRARGVATPPPKSHATFEIRKYREHDSVGNRVPRFVLRKQWGAALVSKHDEVAKVVRDNAKREEVVELFEAHLDATNASKRQEAVATESSDVATGFEARSGTYTAADRLKREDSCDRRGKKESLYPPFAAEVMEASTKQLETLEQKDSTAFVPPNRRQAIRDDGQDSEQPDVEEMFAAHREMRGGQSGVGGLPQEVAFLQAHHLKQDTHRRERGVDSSTMQSADEGLLPRWSLSSRTGTEQRDDYTSQSTHGHQSCPSSRQLQAQQINSTAYSYRNQRPRQPWYLGAFGAGRSAGLVQQTQARYFHQRSHHHQEAAAHAVQDSYSHDTSQLSSHPNARDLMGISSKSLGKTPPTAGASIRAELRKWQEMNGDKYDPHDVKEQNLDMGDGEVSNSLTRLPDETASLQRFDVEEQEEQQAMSAFSHSAKDEQDIIATSTKFLKPGDLVELDSTTSEKESIIAVFVRRLGVQGQFYTMHGRWVYHTESTIQYSIPGWISEDLVTPLIEYLPSASTYNEMEELKGVAYVNDLSVPRHIASSLVSRMVQFHAESEEIYRRHANALDNAHETLAHDADLRYGSLVSVAVALLKQPADKLPVTGLYTVRKALTRAGFAFNVDRRSHRLTGYLQIRSKEQVRNVETVRGWIRDWQDDLSTVASLQGRKDKEKALRHHKTPDTAQYVYDFIEKAKRIVMRSRENRPFSGGTNIGLSKKRFPITPKQDCVKIDTTAEFTRTDKELVKFMEGWAASHIFHGQPRIEALPPLLLQATGLYGAADIGQGVDLSMKHGFVFLQELGVLMPYENRVRFDTHLLLPSSQHSKPLQNLATSLMQMRSNANFSDSMAELRHDWQQLPVYCIDAAGAQEIDDGISIEKAQEETWWIHVHIANPTAFFDRNNPLSKMAQHMGESIYMPERTYPMLPRWVSLGHFSLAANRPCLTFSARLKADGHPVEQKITSGTIRNVLRLTEDDVHSVLALDVAKPETITLTVGGEPPPEPARKSVVPRLTPQNIEQLKTLHSLTEKRTQIRLARGGLFYEVGTPTPDVWQSWKQTGLAWDHPYREGSRRVEGDPVIRMTTSEMKNYFGWKDVPAKTIVRESMLLAGTISAKWCADRHIPAIYRGTAQLPNAPLLASDFKRDVLGPATEASADGVLPMHLGLDYLALFAGSRLSTTPMNHELLGLSHYGKVTSPLRRYGDMIQHWQIEAALREEARRGTSLLTDTRRADRSFLPFSANVLGSIMTGLQPRESMITFAKLLSSRFWTMMLLFRAVNFGEADLPFRTPQSQTFPDGTLKPLMRVYVRPLHGSLASFVALQIDLNVQCSVRRPERLGLGPAKSGDVWECELTGIDVFERQMLVDPVRLVSRIET